MSALSREQVIDFLSNLPVIEIAELVKELEQKWGVSASAPAPVGTALPVPTIAPPMLDEKTEFTVQLKGFGEKKIDVIKMARTLNSSLGLKEAKVLVESAPVAFKEGVSKAEAEEIAAKLREAGADVEIL